MKRNLTHTVFRSASCERWSVQTRHTLLSKSTYVEYCAQDCLGIVCEGYIADKPVFARCMLWQRAISICNAICKSMGLGL